MSKIYEDPLSICETNASKSFGAVGRNVTDVAVTLTHIGLFAHAKLTMAKHMHEICLHTGDRRSTCLNDCILGHVCAYRSGLYNTRMPQNILTSQLHNFTKYWFFFAPRSVVHFIGPRTSRLLGLQILQ